MESTRLKPSAHQKLSTVNPPISLSASNTRPALITRRNSPRVRKVIGSVRITSNGLTLYYDLGNPANSYLGGKTWQLAGGGAIAPVPEPAICLNLLVLAFLAQRTRRSARLWRRE